MRAVEGLQAYNTEQHVRHVRMGTHALSGWGPCHASQAAARRKARVGVPAVHFGGATGGGGPC